MDARGGQPVDRRDKRTESWKSRTAMNAVRPASSIVDERRYLIPAEMEAGCL